MFFRSLRKRLFLLPLIALLATAGCRGDSGDDEFRNEQVTKLLNQGKDLLGKNQWGQSKEVFQRVLDRYDNANSQARFGIVLADLLSFSDTIRLVSSLTDSFSSSASSEENKFVNQLITDLIHDLRSKFAAIDKNLLLVESDPGFTFKIKSLPIYLSDSEVPSVELDGEWDRADAFLLNAAIKAVLGTLNYADSVDLNLDVLRAYDYFSQADFDTDKLTHIESVVTFILNDPNYPNFLSVKKEGGNELVRQSGEDFAAAVKNFQIALYMASLETDNQTDDILQYVDKNNNGKYDPPINPNGDSCAKLATLNTDEEKKKRAGDAALMPENFSIFETILGASKDQPILSEQTACLLQKAYTNLDWDNVKDTEHVKVDLGYSAPPRLNLLHDILPLVAPIVSGAIQDSKDSLPDEIQGIVGLATARVILDLLTDIVGDSIELDPHAFFVAGDDGKAGNVRGLLPVWQNNACASTGICLNDFVIEMECRGYAPGTTLPVALTTLYDELTVPVCTKAWETAARPISDTTHFEAEQQLLSDFDLEPIGKDGIEGRLPYIAFQDASLHGMLHLNLAGLADNYTDSVHDALLNLDAGKSDFQPATLLDMNAFIAALSRNGYIEIALDAVE